MNNDKINKYNREDLLNNIRHDYHINKVKVLAATLNFRGVWTHNSADDLLKDKIILCGELALISLRAILGTHICFQALNQTSMVRQRTGIG